MSETLYLSTETLITFLSNELDRGLIYKIELTSLENGTFPPKISIQAVDRANGKPTTDDIAYYTTMVQNEVAKSFETGLWENKNNACQKQKSMV